MSLKKTLSELSISPIPVAKINTYTEGIKNRTAVHGTGNRSIAYIIITAIRENMKLTNENRTFSRGKIYLGTYTFFISALAPKMDVIAVDVDSEKKLKSVDPVR